MRRVLFIAPAVPSPTRSGLRMRGWFFLRGLAREHRVTLVAGSPAFPCESAADTAVLGDLIEHAVLLRFGALRDPELLWRRGTAAIGMGTGRAWDWAEPTPAMQRQLEPLRGEHFDLIHVFRLYMMPVALAAGAVAGAPTQLDLDDWESQTRLGLARLTEVSDPERTLRLRAEAHQFEQWEREWLPRMSRLFVCSERDAAALSARHDRRKITVMENAVSVPPELAPPAVVEPAELLFIGSLGYYPNEDAVCFLLDEVLPLLRTALARPFTIVVAGEGARHSLRAKMLARSEVCWIDSPPAVDPLYARARVALVPVRAGGGTRVKVLEAFAQGRPVVATAAAVAGLDLEPSIHYLQAESAAEWAAALRRLLETPELGRRLAASAFTWVRERSLEAAVDRVAAFTSMQDHPILSAKSSMP